MAANILPLLRLCDLNCSPSQALITEIKSAFRQYGAIRLEIPEDIRYHPGGVFQHASEFFDKPADIKKQIQGYSPFASESVRGKAVFPKESIYFFREGTEHEDLKYLTPEFYHSVKALNDIWTPLRLRALNVISGMLGSKAPLTGTAFLESATLGVHYYDSRTVHDDTLFSPPHKDSGTLTVLFRSFNGNDGLEIADLQTTEKQDSEGVGSEASFISTPAHDEAPYVILMAGNRFQTLLGSGRARACVHRVRGPGSGVYNDCGVQRYSIAVFCAPSVPSTRRSTP
ncbi:uncharacterized protein APUU_41443S [Aspergillus puulaauensis]|uniref:Isopenicillin N synthase-like Fe(2+) 2OG dioxygenase domain-containing protein n=1 Tax=Aspergillus puulaauensis TaxID=1220207 RepID=A0A7R8AMH4_9EURO|nr:uncharacterized protein APUU_41443S [Aspergillus puulaauensis]BCS24999.1 hypothetical protein APUU_41443S [Aspergillus puulaauensis]